VFGLTEKGLNVQRICLSMIVKNEAPVIARCLASVRPFIARWVVVDTGSTDGTQELVRAALAGMPGELHERPWRDFAHNRNEALALARDHGDYILFIDADETLAIPAGFRWPVLDGDGYMFRCSMDGWDYWRNSLVAAQHPWRWEGVLHEYLASNTARAWRTLDGPRIEVAHDGARGRDPQTYARDIEVLTRAVQDEPGNARYAFYLAQSLRDASRLDEALHWYRRRSTMGGWDEEAWFALFQVAVLLERQQAAASEVSEAYLRAYAARPRRAEPLCELARYLRLRGEHALAHVYALRAAAMPQPPDLLFVDSSVYRWRALDEVAANAYYAGALGDGKAAMDRLFAQESFPPAERARLEANRAFYI
jgi:hypothetical protein